MSSLNKDNEIKKPEEGEADMRPEWRISGKRTPTFVISTGFVFLVLGLIFRAAGDHNLISIWEIKNIRIDLALIIAGTLVLTLFYPLSCTLNFFLRKWGLLTDTEGSENTRLMAFGARFGLWVTLIVAMLGWYLYVGPKRIEQKVSQSNDRILCGFVEDQSRYIIENKRLTPAIADDVNNLTLYTSQVKEYSTPLIKETSSLLLETMDLIGKKGFIEGHKLAFDKFCLKDSIIVTLPVGELKTQQERKLYSYFLVLKGTIANELIFQGRDIEKLDYSRRYFQESLQYNDSCAAAYNGLGNASFIELRNSHSFTEDNVRQASKAIQYYERAMQLSEISTNYCLSRGLNNQACINLEVMNKLFNYTHNPAVFSKLDLDDLNAEDKEYFLEFRNNKSGIFCKVYKNLKSARQKTPQISDICVSLSQYYAILAQYMYRQELQYEPITSRKVIEFSEKIFLDSKQITFSGALSESCFYLKTAIDMGYPVYEVFPDKDVFKEYGYQIYEIVRHNSSFKKHYEELIEILCL